MPAATTTAAPTSASSTNTERAVTSASGSPRRWARTTVTAAAMPTSTATRVNQDVMTATVTARPAPPTVTPGH